MDANQHSKSIFEPVFTKAVPKYIAQCRKEKEKYNVLFPKCVKIFQEEIKNGEWMDECFAKQVLKMLEQAHVSQLQSFYCRYNNSAKKTVFFQRFLRDEL